MWYGKSVFVVCWVKWKMWNNFFYENVDSDVGVFDWGLEFLFKFVGECLRCGIMCKLFWYDLGCRSGNFLFFYGIVCVLY